MRNGWTRERERMMLSLHSLLNGGGGSTSAGRRQRRMEQGKENNANNTVQPLDIVLAGESCKGMSGWIG